MMVEHARLNSLAPPTPVVTGTARGRVAGPTADLPLPAVTADHLAAGQDLAAQDFRDDVARDLSDLT
jgi:hypothetical protein